MKILKTELVLVKDLKPHEEFDKEYHQKLLNDIVNDQAINSPIFVDKVTKIILDGHHRFSVAKKLKLSKIPVLLIDYLDDLVISVFPRRDDVAISKKLVIQAGKKGKLFPNKSTRHVLHIAYHVTPFGLDMLR